MSRPDAILRVTSLEAGYNRLPVIRDVGFDVGEGEAVALLGANGAGKSTILRAISGLIRPRAGSVHLRGVAVTDMSAETLVGRGLAHVAEGRRIFRKMTVADNLEIGLFNCPVGAEERRRRFEEQYDLFPMLREKANTAAGSLSGGQQQMLAISQALIRHPELIMLDEPSTGLAPILIEEIFDKLSQVRQRGVSILLVEQVVERCLDFVDHAYLVQGGKIVAEGAAAMLKDADIVRDVYLGRSV